MKLGFRKKDRLDPDSMTLIEHLAELRRRLAYSVGTLVAMSIVGWFLYSPILHFLQRPYCLSFPHHCALYARAPLDPLSIRVKISLFAGFILAAPAIFYHVWRFITPGLKENEKRYVGPFVVASLLLFLTGGGLAYLIFPRALTFLGTIGGGSISLLISPDSYFNLVLLIIVVFGLSFEFPVVLVGLELARVVTSQQLRKVRRWAILAITITAAVITPSSDPYSMLALGIPMYLFFEASILIGRLMKR
jgi:sec-independent protein translocase protein TatC